MKTMSTYMLLHHYPMVIVAALFLFVSIDLIAQNGQTFRFQYSLDGEKYAGTYKAIIGQTQNGTFFRDLTNQNNPKVNFNNIENGGIRIILSELEWDHANHIRNELHFSPATFKLPEQLILASGRQAKLRTDERIEIDFTAKKNGAVSLVLPLRVFHARNNEYIDETSFNFNLVLQNLEETITPEVTNEMALAAWRKVNQKDIAAVRKYKQDFEKTPGAELANDLIVLMERYPWEEVRRSKDPEMLRLIAYQHAKYPYQEEVKKLLSELDSEKFKAASTKNNIEAYRHYLSEFPSGNHVAQANTALRNLGQQTSKEEEAWYKALEERSVIAITQFLREWPDSRFIPNAQKLLTQLAPLSAFIVSREKKHEGEEFIVKFENAQSRLIVDAVSGDADRSGISYEWKDPITLSILISDEKSKTIHVSESGGASVSIELDVTTEALYVQLDRELNILNFNILGGKPPYEIHFYPEGKDFPIYSTHLASLGESQVYTIKLSELPAQMKGTFVLQIRDSKKTEVFEFDGISLNATSQANYGPYFFLAVIATLFGILYVFRMIRQAKLKANERAVHQKIQQRKHIHTPPPAGPFIKTEPPRMAATNHSQSTQDKSHTHQGIVIKGNRKATIQMSEKERSSFSGVPADDAVVVNLNKVWPDTIVGQVFFQKDMLQSLHDFLEEHQWKQVRENLTSIPEVGGFLMGTFMQNSETGQYDIHIINFVPVTPEKHDVYKIEFGTTAWTELADIQDRYNHLNTIGWFHTHPGHGLFLSMPDLRIQKGFFGLPYQVAMEIDPLSQDIDMAIFTQKRNGDINNSSDRLSNVGWYRWNDIMNQVNR